MTREDLELFRTSRYCDNASCSCYEIVGGDNIRIKSRKTGQIYCKICKNAFSVRRGTMFFDLRTPIDKIVQVLRLLTSGMGSNALVRETGAGGSGKFYPDGQVRELNIGDPT